MSDSSAATPPSRRVLVTGGAGAIGKAVCAELKRRGHAVRSFDQRTAEHADENTNGDIADAETVHQAMSGVDAVVHLAAQPDDAPFLERLLQPNVAGLFNVMNAAKEAGVKRVALASSMQVVSGVPGGRERMLTAADAAPKNHYALTKVWAEAMGEMYARCHGMSVVAARIGWMTRGPGEASRLDQAQAYDAYLSPADAGRFFAQAVEAEFEGFHVLYALSRPRQRTRADLDTARRIIGYEPQDTFPEGLNFPWP